MKRKRNPNLPLLPDSFEAAAIGYPRWLVLETNGHGVPTPQLVAIVTGQVPQKSARRLATSIATALRREVVIVPEYRGRKNPTLVHHGKATAARWHIITAGGETAVADLYQPVEPSTAGKVAHALASALGVPLLVLSNRGLPKSLAGHSIMRERSGGLEHRPHSRTNPAGRPVAGEIWTTLAGGRCKILSANATQVQVLHMETGNREWIGLSEFFASYRLRTSLKRRRNPSRSPAAKAARKRIKSDARKSPQAWGVSGVAGRSAKVWLSRSRYWTASKATAGRWVRAGAEDAALQAADPNISDVKIERLPGKPAPVPRRVSPARPAGPRFNPRGERAKAVATFKKWHEFPPSRVTRVKGPGRTIPKTLVKAGELVSFVYRSDKYTGKPELYEHKTKSPHPVLALSPDGRSLHIVGGKMKATADGFVN